MRFWLYFVLFMCVITLCISDDSSSSESNEDSGEAGGGRGRGNNTPRGGGRGRGTVNTNKRGNGNTNQQRRGNVNNNQQGRGNGNTNQQSRGTGKTNQQGGGTNNTNTQDRGTGNTRQPGRGTGNTRQQGQRPGIQNGGNRESMLGTSNSEWEENSKKDHPCYMTCAPTTSPRRRVCGSDGVTYDTFCLLKAARCINPDLKFESRGTCPTSSNSASEDSDEETRPNTAVETCDLTCAQSSNSRRRVCGSDGVTYDTYCLLEAARCINPDLKFESRGTCPTSSSSASEDSDEETRPNTAVHSCDLECAPSSNPRRRVCGTDGVTYDTFCYLKEARCVDSSLDFSARGACPDPRPESEDPTLGVTVLLGTDVTFGTTVALETILPLESTVEGEVSLQKRESM